MFVAVLATHRNTAGDAASSYGSEWTRTVILGEINFIFVTEKNVLRKRIEFVLPREIYK